LKIDLKTFYFVSKKTRIKNFNSDFLSKFNKNKIESCIQEHFGMQHISEQAYELDMVDFYLLCSNDLVISNYIAKFELTIKACLTWHKLIVEEYDAKIKKEFAYKRSVTVKYLSFFIFFKALFNSKVKFNR